MKKIEPLFWALLVGAAVMAIIAVKTTYGI